MTRPSTLAVKEGSEGPDVWVDCDGAPISCLEKIKVLDENLAEIEELVQEALDDAVLMGVEEQSAKRRIAAAVEKLKSRFPKSTN